MRARIPAPHTDSLRARTRPTRYSTWYSRTTGPLDSPYLQGRLQRLCAADHAPSADVAPPALAHPVLLAPDDTYAFSRHTHDPNATHWASPASSLPHVITAKNGRLSSARKGHRLPRHQGGGLSLTQRLSLWRFGGLCASRRAESELGSEAHDPGRALRSLDGLDPLGVDSRDLHGLGAQLGYSVHHQPQGRDADVDHRRCGGNGARANVCHRREARGERREARGERRSVTAFLLRCSPDCSNLIIARTTASRAPSAPAVLRREIACGSSP